MAAVHQNGQRKAVRHLKSMTIYMNIIGMSIMASEGLKLSERG
jgi:hypothetical protein